MAQPRYNQVLQEFIREWRPNDLELDRRFVASVIRLVKAILDPPANVFEVTTILSESGGKVVVRLGENEAQLDPVAAQHLGLSLMEAATGARTESWLQRFILAKLQLPEVVMAQLIAEFRNYRIEEMEKALAGDLEKQGRPLP